MKYELMDVLGHFVQRSHYSAGQVAALSGVPKRTIINWLTGRVRKPHQWQAILPVAAALHLTESETNQLLQAAGYPPLATLRRESNTGREQFAPWPEAPNNPFQAIADLPYFVGRTELLNQVQTTLRQGQYVTIYNLHGMGGIGKTTLAAHLAYQMRSHFTDGVLWARLDTSDTMTILQAFALAYGQDVSNYHDIESRATAVRAILADKQALIILDNAQNSTQVRPLLPPSTGKTAVIITTRHDLAVADETYRLLVEPFTVAGGEAMAVFAHFLGRRTVNQWAKALQSIADLVGHLPLAVAIAAGRLANSGNIPAYLAALQEKSQRLDVLVREDRNVRLTFDLSYEALDPPLQHFFAVLGAFGGQDFDLLAAAAVGNVSVEEAQDYVTTLQKNSLLQPGRDNRYTLHPLLRQYALEKQPDSSGRERMIGFYLQLLRRDNLEEIELEQDNALAALHTAQEISRPEQFLNGVTLLYPFWERRGLYRLALPYLQQAAQVADEQNDPAGQANHLYRLGKSLWIVGQYETAENYLQQGLQVAEQIQDMASQSRCLLSLGTIAGYNRGDYDLAEQYALRALALARQLNDGHQLVLLLSNLGNGAYERGDWSVAEQYWLESLAAAEAQQVETTATGRLLLNLGVLTFERGQGESGRSYLKQALSLAEKLQDSEIIGTILATIGWQALQMGELTAAQTWLQKALALGRQTQHTEIIALTLGHLGALATTQKQFAQAAAYLAEANAVCQHAQIAWLSADVSIRFGELYLAQAFYDQAAAAFNQAVDQAKSYGMLEQQGLALFGLAQAEKGRGEVIPAGQHAQESLTILTKLGHYKAQPIVRNELPNEWKARQVQEGQEYAI